MIISTNRKHINSYENNNKIKNRNNENKLSNIIGFSGNNKSISDIEDDYFNINKNKDKNNFDIDENYLLNTSFENQRSDFSIMYTYDYEKTVMDDLLSFSESLFFKCLFSFTFSLLLIFINL